MNFVSLDGLKNGDQANSMSGDIHISYFMSPDFWVCCLIFLACCRRMDIRKRLDAVDGNRCIILRKLGQELKGGVSRAQLATNARDGWFSANLP